MRPEVEVIRLSISFSNAARQTRFLGGEVSRRGEKEHLSLMNSSEGHLSKKDIRSRTEISVPVAKVHVYPGQ